MANTVERLWAWHASIAFGQHTQSNDVRRSKTLPPLVSTHGQTTSGVACHHRLWAAHTVERSQAWHAIIAFGQNTRSDDVGCGMPSLTLGSTHGRTMSAVACHHRLWAAQTVERCRAWRAIIAFVQHKRSDGVRRGMPSSPLRSTLGITCHHRLLAAHTVE